MWKWVDQKIKTLENIIHGVSCEVEQAQIQLANRYEYAADLFGKLDDCNAKAAAAEDRIETVMARQTGFEQEMIESDGSLREVWAYGTWRVCQKRQADSRAVPPHAGARKGQFGPLES